MDNRWHKGMVCVGLALGCLVIYGQTLGFSFLLCDDDLYVTDAPQVQAGLTWAGVKWAFMTDRALNYHPITWLSHMLDCQVYGLRPWGHHLTSALLHTLNSVLLFLVLFRMTRSLGASGLAAALWAFHPMRVESTAWVAERKDVLSTSFWLLALLAYARYATGPGLRRGLGVAAAFVMAVLSKPMTVTLPCVLLLLDYWPLGRIAPQEGRLDRVTRITRLLMEKSPLLLASFAVSYVTIVMQNRGGAMPTLETLPFGVRIANAVAAYSWYLLKAVWPWPLGMYYPLPATPRPGWQIGVSLTVLLAITALAVYQARSRPYLLVGWLWFIITLFPVSGILQTCLAAYASRYSYIPMMGLCIMAAWGVNSVYGKNRAFDTLLHGFLALVLTAYVAGSFIQTRYWRDGVTLFEHAAKVTPNNSFAEYSIANALVQAGRSREAIPHYREALRITPDYPDAHNNLAVELTGLGNAGEAIVHFSEALRFRPDHVEARNGLALTLASQGRFEEAVAHHRKALEIAPNDPRTHFALAGELSALGRNQEAIEEYVVAIRLHPGFAPAYNNLGMEQARQGQIKEAVASLLKAVAVDPGYDRAEINLGYVLMSQGRRDDALVHFRRALEISPANEEARRALERISK